MRILHLSDIHLNNGNIAIANRLIDKISKNLREIQKERQIDFILITGDLVDRGGKSYGGIGKAFEDFENKIVYELLKITGLDRSRIIICPGNHDLDGTTINSNDENKIVINSSDEANGFINYQVAISSELGNYATNRLEEYNSYADSFQKGKIANEDIIANPISRHIRYEIEGHMIGFSCLNSVWRCNENGEGNPFILGFTQINEAKEFLKKCDLKIGLVHNAPSTLADWEQNDVNDIIQKNYDILFYGHKHMKFEGRMETPAGVCTYFCASGTIPSNAGNTTTYRNGFRVVDIDLQTYDIIDHKYIQNKHEDFVPDTEDRDDGSWRLISADSRRIKKAKESLLQLQSHRHPLIRNKIIDAIISRICSDRSDIQIYGLPGLGKTKILFEACLEIEKLGGLDNVYYCNRADGSELFNSQLETILCQNEAKSCTIIFDNCTNRVFRNCLRMREDFAADVRFIAIFSDVYNVSEVSPLVFVLKNKDMIACVSEYIDRQIPADGDGLTIREIIKRNAEGFPMLAIRMIESYRKGKQITPHDADILVESFLDDEIKKDGEVVDFMKVLSLFQPFPMDREDAFDAVFNSDIFFPIKGRTPREIRRLKEKVLAKYSDNLIDNGDGGCEVRPFPLALKLASLWFAENSDPKDFDELIQYIENLPNPPQAVIVESMCRRLEYMDDSAAAQDLVEKLHGADGLFRCENVVCSELGSRLILAMSTVNPLAVSTSLSVVFSHRTASWIKENLSKNARNNILWALTKLIRDKDAYPHAIINLGKLALEETDHYLGNNSQGIFRDSFHIYLSGTETPLSERMEVMGKLYSATDELHELTPIALSGALSIGTFMRTGGNKYGSGVKPDYFPTREEIFDYWEASVRIAENLLNSGEFVEQIGEIIRTNYLQWSASGMIDKFLPLLETFGKAYGNTLGLTGRDWHHFMYNVKRRSSEETYDKVNALYGYYISQNFISKLSERLQSLYDEKIKSRLENIEADIEYFETSAREFIELRIAEDENEMESLIKENEGVSMYFVPALLRIITDDELQALLNTLKQLIAKDGKIGEKPFMAYLIPRIIEREPTERFMKWLLTTGRYSLYVRYMARGERPDLSHYRKMSEIFGKIKYNFFPEYLSNVNLYYDSVGELLGIMNKRFEENPESIIDFIVNHYGFINSEEKNYEPAIKQILVKFDVTKGLNNLQYEYWNYVANMLENKEDKSFAEVMGEKLFDNIVTIGHNYEVDRIIEVLFTKYESVTWNKFAETFFDANPLGYMLLESKVGSGFGFGHGWMYQIDESYLIKALEDYPDTAPGRIAHTCPVFDYSTDKKTLSWWIKYLMDNYGDRKEVRDGISANMGTYQWTGSLIPLLETKVKALTPLLTHNRPEVKEWATNQIESLQKDIKNEKSKEGFERLYYN